MIRTVDTTTIVNLREVNAGSITTINHPAMPDLARLRREDAPETWCLLRGDKLGGEKLGAICSIWTEHVAAVNGYRTAALGHFFAHDPDVGKTLLAHACRQAAAKGFDYLVGPLDGDTWHRYRLVTDQGTTPPFFLEYYTPCDWPGIFLESGFTAIATYCSAQTTELTYADRSAEKFAPRAAAMGLTVRPFNPDRAEAELTALYHLSIQSFAGNFLYTPIGLAEFLTLYQPLLPHLVPAHVLLAEHAGRLVGMLFGIPDYLQPARGEAIDTLIIKTIARAPERRYAGLGSYLAHMAHQEAATAGYKRVIHALMHDENASLVISQKSAQVIRRYALYGKQL